MDDSNLYSKINFLNSPNDSKEKLYHYSLDINDSFYSSILDNKYISTENNEFVEHSNNLYDFDNLFNKETEIKKSNIDDIGDINESNKEELKRQLRLKRNRESAKNGRLRKKIYIENLINQINDLKKENSLLLKIILKCSHCQEIYNKEIEEINTNNNYILKDKNSLSNKSKLLFMTAITLISIFNLFNIFFFNHEQYKMNNKRNLLENPENDYLINKIKSGNKDEALLIHFGEFYSMTTREKILGHNDLKDEINKNIKIYSNDKFNINNITRTNAKKCVKCMVEIDKNSIKLGGDEFTFYLVDKLLSKNFMNNFEDGIFPELNFEKENKKSETFSKVFALKCKIISYSINNIYSDEIGVIS